MDIIYFFMVLTIQSVMGISGAYIAESKRKLRNVRQTKIKIIAGCVGGIILGQLVGLIVGESNSFFAVLGDAGSGIVGGATAISLYSRMRKQPKKW